MANVRARGLPAAYILIAKVNRQDPGRTEIQFILYGDDSLRMMSAFVKTEKAFHEYQSAGIPWSIMIAYIGSENKPSNKEMFDMLHKKRVMCMISAEPLFDKIPSREMRYDMYKKTFASGADILESDLPRVQSSKTKFFKRKRLY